MASSKKPAVKSKFQGVEIRNADTLSVRIVFRYKGEYCKEPITHGKSLRDRELHASRKRAAILMEIEQGNFDYRAHFPRSVSKFAMAAKPINTFIEPTIDSLLDTYIRIITDTMATETARGYKSKIKNQVRPFFGVKKPSEILPSEIISWKVVDMAGVDGQLICNKTKNEALIPLRAVLTNHRTDLRAKRLDHIHIDELLGALEQLPEGDDEDIEIDQFTVEEMAAIAAVTDPKLVQIRNQLLFACHDGPRVSEVLGLGWQDIDTHSWMRTYERAHINGKYKVTKTKKARATQKLLDPAIEILKQQKQWTYALPPIQIQVMQRDNKTLKTIEHKPVFVNPRTQKPFSSCGNYSTNYASRLLAVAGVRHRGPNQARHTFCCKTLTAGMPDEWVAKRARHTSTDMIRKVYGDFIVRDLPGLEDMASERLGDLLAGKSFEGHFKKQF